MKKDLEEKIMDGIREAYERATPPASLDYLMSLEEPVNFWAYYISSEDLDNIVNKMCRYQREHKKKVIKFNMYLGATPSSADFYYKIYKDGEDGFVEAKRIKWVDGAIQYDYPKEGRSLSLSPGDTLEPITKLIGGYNPHPNRDDIEFETDYGKYRVEYIIIPKDLG